MAIPQVSDRSIAFQVVVFRQVVIPDLALKDHLILNLRKEDVCQVQARKVENLNLNSIQNYPYHYQHVPPQQGHLKHNL